jgi:hypothetical protein
MSLVLYQITTNSYQGVIRMKTNNLAVRLLAAVFLLALVSVTEAKKTDPPLVTEDGLHLVPDGKLALVYADPEADLSYYNKVYLVEASVAFKKNWARDQRRGSASSIRVSSSDMEKIKTRLAEEFHTVFKTELEEHGYELTDIADHDVMIVRPAIINLDVNAPDIPSAGRSTSFTSSAGEMTLYIELIDSVTGDIFAKALDRRADNSAGGYYTWSNSVTNRAAAQRILKGWATILRKALDEARQDSSD